MQDARIVLESAGSHVVVGLSSAYALRALGIDLPPELLTVLPTPSTAFGAMRRGSLDSKNEQE
jgi:hypothetical protein